jgi:hypothetical protein
MALPKRGETWHSNDSLMKLVVTEFGELETRVVVVTYPSGNEPAMPIPYSLHTEILLSSFHLINDPLAVNSVDTVPA